MIWVLRTQRNMRIHFAIATVVLILAFAYDVSKLELVALLLAIAFVLTTEMINTAVEAATDIATTSFDPLAKLAKDLAAGAVLIASVNAVVVGYLVLADRLGEPTNDLLVRIRDAPLYLTVTALLVVMLLVIAVKAVTGRGTPMRGGLPSGHAALAFAGWMAITFVTEGYSHRALVSAIAFVLALLVAQTRVESGIHSTFEVAVGGRPGGSRDARALPGVRIAVDDADLLELAGGAAAHAYAPYSGLAVGAALALADGRVVSAANVENASYGLSLCAERAALARAVAEGIQPGQVTVLAVTAPPCGACRQWIVEFRVGKVVYRTARGTMVTAPAADLLPDAFEIES